jgi:thioredoxin-like negative regulator of GroEL
MTRLKWYPRSVLVTAVAVLALVAPLAGAAEKKAAIYDEQADAKAEIAKAVARARKQNKRVLIMYGGNWCSWCHKLHDVLRKDAAVRKTASYEYELVLVDIRKNRDIAKSYGAEASSVPYLTILDGAGKPLVNQRTEPFEVGSQHDPKKVQEFLAKWAATPLDAEKLLKDALAKAKQENKRLLIHLGAPW